MWRDAMNVERCLVRVVFDKKKKSRIVDVLMDEKLVAAGFCRQCRRCMTNQPFAKRNDTVVPDAKVGCMNKSHCCNLAAYKG